MVYRVLAHVDAKMVKPQPERPYEGQISIHSEISPMASSEYESGRWVCVTRLHSQHKTNGCCRPSEEEVTIDRKSVV